MRDLDTAWSELEPWLDTLEAERRAGVRRFGWSVPLAGVAGLGVFAAAALAGAPGQVALVGAGIVAALIASWGYSPLGALKRKVKLGLNQRVAEAFGLVYREAPGEPSGFNALRRFELLPHADRKSFEDHFAGEAHGARFELYEAELQQRRRTKNRTYYVTVFRGAIIRIAFPRTVEGVTLVTRDKGMFNAFESWGAKTFGRAGRKLERIGLVDPTFEKLFEVYGTDQVMARYLLTPSFMERLLELETLLSGKNVRAVFDEDLAPEAGRGELLIAAETGNQFEPGSLFKPLAERARIEAIYAEIKLIDDIITTLLEPADFRGTEPA
ncbi:MAG: DUF3137 domain-containing protein [Oceanicaulis sp.]